MPWISSQDSPRLRHRIDIQEMDNLAKKTVFSSASAVARSTTRVVSSSTVLRRLRPGSGHR
ncbi:hypothetical protein TIFTF001_007709 [Ficus carica]|uniref:Uncharacterized protein n=1 Tax=Ficus carica TaxID=3494 RepID=A0AA87ZS43_FICCA|nr:hypothetical protein TIFTF001_007709 [Ficus carica]